MNEFKKFILRGNVVDLAVGVLIGAAFGSVVNSLVKDIFTPLVAAIGGQPDFSSLKITIHGSALMYGSFISALITFLIVAMVVFFAVVKPMNAITKRLNQGKQETPDTRQCPECLSTIPLKARRCAHCTTLVSPDKSAPR